jgi:hypothetical protein
MNLFEKKISINKMKKKIQEYQTFVLQDIFPEYELKEYLNSVEKIIQKNGEHERLEPSANSVSIVALHRYIQ